MPEQILAIIAAILGLIFGGKKAVAALRSKEKK